MRQVYLDNNATTQVDPVVLEEMLPYLKVDFGNASSVHAVGQRARAAAETARDRVADLIGSAPREVVFTSGGTEADNGAILGVARAKREKGNHIVTSQSEHPAVLRICEFLENDGYRVTYLGVNREGLISLTELKEVLCRETILVSVMFANNETGVIQPLAEVSQLARAVGAVVHTDAVQAVGKIPVDVDSLGVDLLSLSAHKLHGPKGVGALYVRDGTALEPFMVGGGQERNRRGGTENVPGIVGLGRACEEAGLHLQELNGPTRLLRDRFEQVVLDQIEGTEVNGSKQDRTPHVSSISFDGVEGESLLVALDFEGVAVSTGAACASGSVAPSHVLVAMGLPEAQIQGAIRFSLSRFTTSDDMDYVLEVLPRVMSRMAQVSAPRSS